MSEPLRTALWVVRDRIATPGAIDDLLADSVGWNVRDLGALPLHDRLQLSSDRLAGPSLGAIERRLRAGSPHYARLRALEVA